MNDQDQLLNEILELKLKLRDLSFQHYKQYEVFHWQWWINIALLVVPIVLWWLALDKKRILEICLFGLLVNMMATFLDVAGTNYGLWEYPFYILPHLPILIPVDYVIVPVIGMTIYQLFSSWKAFIIVGLIMGAVMAFICEPLAVYIHLYKLISWRYIYSFPIYSIIYIGARIVTKKFTQVNNLCN
jgi:hypothetical protein